MQQIHWLIHSLTHSITHSLTLSLTHWVPVISSWYHTLPSYLLPSDIIIYLTLSLTFRWLFWQQGVWRHLVLQHNLRQMAREKGVRQTMSSSRIACSFIMLYCWLVLSTASLVINTTLILFDLNFTWFILFILFYLIVSNLVTFLVPLQLSTLSFFCTDFLSFSLLRSFF